MSDKEASLIGKTTLVVGGSRGIGAAIARRLAKDGAAVAITYHASPEKADAVVRDILALNRKALAIQADSAEVNAVKAAVAKTVEELGGLDILVNNAGILTHGVYSMTKAAIAAMTRGLAIDLAPRGITVNNVQPGPTVTDMNPLESPHHDTLIRMLPVGRMGHPEEIAGMVSYLASSEAGYVTGSSLTIDGGLTA